MVIVYKCFIHICIFCMNEARELYMSGKEFKKMNKGVYMLNKYMYTGQGIVIYYFNDKAINIKNLPMIIDLGDKCCHIGLRQKNNINIGQNYFLSEIEIPDDAMVKKSYSTYYTNKVRILTVQDTLTAYDIHKDIMLQCPHHCRIADLRDRNLQLLYTIKTSIFHKNSIMKDDVVSNASMIYGMVRFDEYGGVIQGRSIANMLFRALSDSFRCYISMCPKGRNLDKICVFFRDGFYGKHI